MARLVLSETDGSPSQELQSLAAGLWLEVTAGGIHALASARGENDEYPGTPGKEAGEFIADELKVKVAGPLWGDGATPAARRAAYRTRMAAIKAILGYEGKVVRLTAHPPNEGLTGAETAVIDVQVVRWVLPAPGGWEQQEHVELNFVCIDNPPEWTVA